MPYVTDTIMRMSRQNENMIIKYMNMKFKHRKLFVKS